jgi:hypothetical protein
MTDRRRRRSERPRRTGDALAIAIRTNDWERAATLLLLGASMAVQTIPPETLDDLLDLLAGNARDGTDGEA